ncbi:MAG: hypothetical protein QM724_04400 [Flavobacteriales bacterium]
MRRWFQLSLLFFAVAATIGALLRLIYVVELPWLVFKPWLHAHSHVAMLGWLFPGLLIALLRQDDRPAPRRFRTWMTLSMAFVVGMLVSFPIQGYGPISIACSLAQMFVGYALSVQVWRHTSRWPVAGSRLLVRLALLFQAISTIGVWAMGPIMHSGLAGSEWYYWSIQWFLHFQFNGWFWFAAMAIGSRWAERHGVDVQLDRLTVFLWVIGTVLTFALAIAWSERTIGVIAVNSVGVLVQAWAAWRTLRAMQHARPQAQVRTTRWMRIVIGTMLIAMAVKVAAQAAASIPAVADIAVTLRNYVVGFVHLNTIGAATMVLMAFALERRWLDEACAPVRAGLALLIAGFAFSELLLFGQGTLIWIRWGMLPGYHWMLFAVSAMLPIGVLLLVAGSRSGENV